MDQKVCLDTDVCIEILKNTERGKALLKTIENSKVYLSTITVFELFLRKTNLFPIETLIHKTAILDFNELAAKKASELFKSLQSSGKSIDLRDLFIASTAITHNCALATLNEKHFKNISGLKIISVS